MIRRPLGSVQIPDELLEAMGFETVGGRLRKLEAELAALRAGAADHSAEACRKVERGQALSRAEAAAYLSISTKKLQRMESAGTLTRCPGLGTVVRYPARDVLRLAMASGRKGA